MFAFGLLVRDLPMDEMFMVMIAIAVMAALYVLLLAGLGRGAPGVGRTPPDQVPALALSETQVATTSTNYSAGRGDCRVFKRDEYPDDLVGTVIFLLSDASGFISGQTFNVDGGESMH